MLLCCCILGRVPDELRKHYLSDGEGGQYSTNLDRNRYGNDDQYLFTGEVLSPQQLLYIAALKCLNLCPPIVPS